MQFTTDICLHFWKQFCKCIMLCVINLANHIIELPFNFLLNFLEKLYSVANYFHLGCTYSSVTLVSHHVCNNSNNSTQHSIKTWYCYYLTVTTELLKVYSSYHSIDMILRQECSSGLEPGKKMISEPMSCFRPTYFNLDIFFNLSMSGQCVQLMVLPATF